MAKEKVSKLKLSNEPTAQEYLKLQGKIIKHRNSIVRVTKHVTSNKGGSWERGFRFYKTTYAALKRLSDGCISLDHGKTWVNAGFSLSTRAFKGKIKLNAENYGEFAFEVIQRINREWEGSGFRWHR